MALSYDSLPWNKGLLFDLQMREHYGLVNHDHAKPHHTCTQHGPPTRRLTVDDVPFLEFDPGNPDWLDCPAADTTDLDFTTGDFTLAAWVYLHAYGCYLLVRGEDIVGGWEWAVGPNGEVFLRTSQLGASQYTSSSDGAVPLNTWALLVTTRAGAVVTHYINGVVSVGTTDVHVDPATIVAKLHIGIDNTESAACFDGGLWRPRIWGRALTAAEVA